MIEVFAEESRPNLIRLEEHGTYLCKVLSANVFPMSDDWETPGISFAFEVLDGSKRYIPYSVWCKSYTKVNGEVQLGDDGLPEVNPRKALLARGNWISLLSAIDGNEGGRLKMLYIDQYKASSSEQEQFELTSDKFGLVPVSNVEQLPEGYKAPKGFFTLEDFIGLEVILETRRDSDGYITLVRSGWHNANDIKEWDVEHKVVRS